MRTYSEKALKNVKTVNKGCTDPWKAEWTSSEIEVLNDSKELSLAEVSILIPSKTMEEIYWRKYSDDLAKKAYSWLIRRKIKVFRPSKLCANSVAGLYYKKEAEEVLRVLIEQGKVVQNPNTLEYIVKANVNKTFIKKYKAKFNNWEITKKSSNSGFFGRIFDMFKNMWFN